MRKELDGRQLAPKTVAVLADPVLIRTMSDLKFNGEQENTPQIEKAFSKHEVQMSMNQMI